MLSKNIKPFEERWDEFRTNELLNKGRLAGRLEGELKGELKGIINILTLKFGSIPANLIEKINSIKNSDNINHFYSLALKANSSQEFSSKFDDIITEKS